MTTQRQREYSLYIESDRWKIRRRLFRIKHPTCQKCGSSEELHVHHATYERLENELDEDLRTLCKECHKALHKKHKRSKHTLLEATNLFLAGKLLHKKERSAVNKEKEETKRKKKWTKLRKEELIPRVSMRDILLGTYKGKNG